MCVNSSLQPSRITFLCRTSTQAVGFADEGFFWNNFVDSHEEEQANQKVYEDLKAAETQEIQAGQEQIDEKTQELVTTDEQFAE